MAEKRMWKNLANRNKNFHNTIINSEADDPESKNFFENLYNFKKVLVQKLNKEDLTNTKKLDLFFHQMFVFTVSQAEESAYFIEVFSVDEEIFLFDSVFEACSYSTLCMFLHNSKRIEGKRLREIVYEHSRHNYKEEGYKIYNYSNGLSEEEASFRKMRNRILSERSAYDTRSKWQSVSKDSEYEWAFYFKDLNDELKDTYKRIGNLYNDVNKALQSTKDDGYNGRLQVSYNKFLSKLKKIKYKNYLDLQKEIIRYLSDNKEYYGINIYRFEKELMLYKITTETNTLLNLTQNNDDDIVEDVTDFLQKTFILKDLPFPNLYNDLMVFLPHVIAEMVEIFYNFQDCFVRSSCLVLDELVEKGFFDDQWEDFFIKSINEKAESVFYVPDQINFNSTPELQLQTAFETILMSPVAILLNSISKKFENEQ